MPTVPSIPTPGADMVTCCYCSPADSGGNQSASALARQQQSSRPARYWCPLHRGRGVLDREHYQGVRKYRHPLRRLGHGSPSNIPQPTCPLRPGTHGNHFSVGGATRRTYLNESGRRLTSQIEGPQKGNPMKKRLRRLMVFADVLGLVMAMNVGAALAHHEFCW